MLRNALRSFALVIAVTSLAGLAVASGGPKCPKCHMELTTKKDKVHTLAVKVKNKTYYCCATCGAHKAKTHAKTKSN